MPKIRGIREFEGKGVSYCAVCDAFFYRGKDVVVLGNGAYAQSEANELLPLAASVTVLTDGKPLLFTPPDGVRVVEKKILELQGNERLSGVLFEDASNLPAHGLFVAYGVAGSADLARKIGAVTQGPRIVTDENMATNIPGLYAAGDCTGGLLQVSKAVYDGAKAGMQAVLFLRGKKGAI